MKFFNRLTALIVIGVVITTALPIMAAISLARAQATESERRYVLDLARQALVRSELTGEQHAAAVSKIQALDPATACGPEGLDLMRTIDLHSTMLQAVGWMEGDTMRCSSFGGNRAFALGPPDFESTRGSYFRVHVNLIEQDTGHIAIQAGPAVTIIHHDLPLSFVDEIPGMGLSAFSWSQRTPMSLRGDVPAELFGKPFAGNTVFRYDGKLVAVVKSERFDLGAIAVLPAGYVTDYGNKVALVLIPIGIVLGLILSALLLYVVRNRLSMPAMIRSALARRQFRLHYQPLVDLASGRIVGAEALIRWDRGKAGEIPAEHLIEAAEEAGLMAAVTRHVFDLLAEDAYQALAISPEFRFAVNLSASDLHRPKILGEVTRLLERSGLEPHNLVIEATERSLVDVERARETIDRLREMGVRLAIDDFGTGYSSLAYLARIEADFLKIDRLFVQALGTESATSQVAARIIEMGKDLHLTIIAEGIETRRQEQLLKRLDVEFAQGFLYGQAMAMEDLLVRLQADRKRRGTRSLRAAA